MGGKIEKSRGGPPLAPQGGAEAAVRAVRAQLRPSFIASLLSPASAPPLGPDGIPTCDFSNLNFHREKHHVTQQKNVRYSAKSTLLRQKQRCYTYDIVVYAKSLLDVLLVLSHL